MAAKAFGICSFDERLSRLTRPPIILNHLKATTKADKQAIKNLVITSYSPKDTLSSVPTCDCGATRGAHNKVCPICHTPVVHISSADMESNVWIEAPESMGYFISPIAWWFLSQAFKLDANFNCLEWFCDPKAKDPKTYTGKKADILRRVMDLDIPRGYRSFIDNIDKFIEMAAMIQPAKSVRRQEFLDFFKLYKNAVMSKYISIPSKIAFVTEQTNVGTYCDYTISDCIEAAFISIGMNDNVSTPVAMKRLESKMTRIMVKLATFYHNLECSFLNPKKGWKRHVLFGSRVNFSYRSVITSMHSPHSYDTLHIPYPEGVKLLHPMLMNKLINKYDYNYTSAYDYIVRHTPKRDEFLHSVMMELVNESIDPEDGSVGIPTLLTRYPSLARTSTQGFLITGFTEKHIEISVLTIKGPNGDFDGDQLSGVLLLDNFSRKYAKLLMSHNDIHRGDMPHRLNNNIQLPVTVNGNIAHWIETEENLIGY